MTIDFVKDILDNSKLLTHEYLKSSTNYDPITAYVSSLIFYKYMKGIIQQQIPDTHIDMLMADIDQVIEDHTNEFFKKQ